MCSIDPGKTWKSHILYLRVCPVWRWVMAWTNYGEWTERPSPTEWRGGANQNPIVSYHKFSMGIEIWRQSSEIAISNTNLQAILRLCLKYSSDWWGGGGWGVAHIVTLKAYSATQWLHNSDPVSCSLASWVQVRVARLPRGRNEAICITQFTSKFLVKRNLTNCNWMGEGCAFAYPSCYTDEVSMCPQSNVFL